MTIRKPDPKTAVRMLRQAFANHASDGLKQTQAYDLLAQIEGYKNWAHYCASNSSQMPELPVGAVLPERVKDWPVWVIFGSDDEEEPMQVMPYGSTFENRVAHRNSWVPFIDDGSAEMPSDLFVDDDARLAAIVLEEAYFQIPRIDRYGVPPQTQEALVGDWASESLGWSYLCQANGEPRVGISVNDSGDDSLPRFWAQVRVSPELHARLLEVF